MRITDALLQAQIHPVDAEVLLAWVLHCDRASLLAHPERPLPLQAERQWREVQERRRKGEPVSYIIGEREFYGRIFRVDRRVHIPRPATENLVEMTLDFLRSPKQGVRELEPGIVGISRVLRTGTEIHSVVDIGTGSGCIAITIALERPDLQVIAVDISEDALDVARENALRLGARNVRFLQSDLMAGLSSLQDPYIVVSNPPYLSSEDINKHGDLRFEPRLALDGGVARTSVIDRLLYQTAKNHCHGIIIECMATELSDTLH